MFKSYQIGTIRGIPFKLDVTLLLILPVFAAIIGGQIGDVVPQLNDAFGTAIDPDPLTSGLRPWVLGFVAAVALFVCVALHELGHAAVSLAYGYEIESITLWLLGGIAKPAERPGTWGHEFWIAVAGPLVNVAIAAGCGLALLVSPGIDVVVFLLLYLAVLNVALAVFNMLPAFPLDGGRVLRALLARSQPYVRATRQAAAVGKGFAVLLGLLGIMMLDFILVAIALFVYIAATSESRQMMLDAAFEGVTIAAVMTTADDLTTVDVDLALSEFLDVMLDDRHIGYPVLDDGEFVGIVTLADVKSTETTDGTVADVMTPVADLQTVPVGCEVMDAFTSLNDNEVGRLPVVEDGELRGLVTRTDLMRAFKIVTEQRRFEDDGARPTLTSPRR
jgi:Zn-dependent protease/predicted transcriptional regulator